MSYRGVQTAFAILVASSSLAFVVSACSDHPCRTPIRPELAEQQNKGTLMNLRAGASTPAAKPDTAKVGTTVVGAEITSTSPTPTPDATLLIYRPDGSLQCGAAKGVAPQEMEDKQLQGIHVYSRERRPDGLMHIQICGAPTGIINVFEIPASSLKEAENRGFKKFENR